jgi:hypothetical protein
MMIATKKETSEIKNPTGREILKKLLVKKSQMKRRMLKDSL